jgi:hypothetical protein
MQRVLFMKALDPNHISKLEAELCAIELWDYVYFEAQVHDKISSDSFRARQERREEILRTATFMITTNQASLNASMTKFNERRSMSCELQMPFPKPRSLMPLRTSKEKDG